MPPGSARNAILALLGAFAVAQSASGAPQLAFLKPQDVAPAGLLPPPPPPDSAAAAAEVQEVRKLARAATPERWAQAKWDNDNENGTIFQSAIAPGFDLGNLPATDHMLRELQHEDDAAASMAKAYFKRTRPQFLDPSLKACEHPSNPNTSYPSGHATMAYSMAAVLSAAMPELGPQLQSRAKSYAESRLICAAHFRSDISAGQTLGVAVAMLMLRDPAFHADFEAAKAELRAAHLSGAAD